MSSMNSPPEFFSAISLTSLFTYKLFIDDLKSVLDKVSEDQLSAQRIAQSYEIGEESSIAKVMVAQQVSSLGFNMVLNVRNKVLSAYRDIINMPV
jgi:flagellar hook-basal body complex protein FliE